MEKVRVVVDRLQRLDDRLGLSPESRWDRRGGPRRVERWVLSHSVVYALALAALALVLFVGELAGPAGLIIAVFLIVRTLGARRRWLDWQQVRGALEQPEGP